MSERYLRQSPLAHLHLDARAAGDAAIADAGVTLHERPLTGMINLRGDASKAPFPAAIKKALGMTPPSAANTAAGAPDGPRLLWLGPDEWLLATAGAEVATTVVKLREATSALHAAVTEVGEARTVIRLAGVNARQVLAKGCSLDLHPRAFAPGRCAQSQLARAAVIIDHTRHDDATAAAEFDLYVLRSFAEYLWTWIEDAGREYGVKVTPSR